MKILSKTDQGGRVVELTEREFREFMLLAGALEGREEQDVYFNFNMGGHEYRAVDQEVPLNSVFGAIRAYYQAKFRANEIRNLLDKFDGFLREQN